MSATSGGAFLAGLWAKFHAEDRPPLEDPTSKWNAFEAQFLSVVRRGVLGPTVLLVATYGLYSFGAVRVLLGLDAGWLVVGLGGCIHLALALTMARGGVLRPTVRGPREVASRWARFKVLISALFLPSHTRWQTLEMRAFSGSSCRVLLGQHGVTYLTAADLSSGEECIFSEAVLAPLTRPGCRAVLKGSSLSMYAEVADLPLAQAVAASTAFPPWFRPVFVDRTMFAGRSYIDGGVVDNAAINVLRNLLWFGKDLEEELGSRRHAPSLRGVARVLVLDGGAEPNPARRGPSGRLRCLLRLPSLLLDHHHEEIQATVDIFERGFKIPTYLLALRTGFFEDHPPYDTDPGLGTLLGRVRTHLDRFSAQECAALAYCGYTQVDDWSKRYMEELSGQPGFEITEAPLRSYPEFLAAPFAAPQMSIQEITHHLRFSDMRTAFLRMLARKIPARRSWPR